MRPTIRSSIIAATAMFGSIVPSVAALAQDSAASPAPTQGASAGYFHPLDPARLLDTRTGLGATGKVGQDQAISLRVTGRGGVPAEAGAVVLNVTVVEPSAAGYVTVHPTGSARPTASNLNFTPGQVVPNLVIAKVGAGGSVDLYNSHGSTHLIADVMGWYDDLSAPSPTAALTGARQRGLTPTRLLDTRQHGGPVGPGGSTELQVAGVAGIPANATAVVLNVTVTAPTTAGYVTVHPNGTALPTASNLNFAPGQTVPNLVIAKVGAGGKVRLYNSHGSTHLVVDATAYFEPVTQAFGGGELTATNPARVLDTRVGLGAGQHKLGPGETITLDVTGVAGVPDNIGSVVLNVTVTSPTSGGYVTVHPSDGVRPTASNLNFSPGQTVPNLVIVKVGADGTIKLFNSHGETHVVADVAGWFGADAATPPTPGTPPPPTGSTPPAPTVPVPPPGSEPGTPPPPPSGGTPPPGGGAVPAP